VKTSRFLILFLLLAVAIQASPRHRRPHHPHYRNVYYYRYSSPYYHYHFGYRYYEPLVVKRTTTTVYPSELETITAESVSEELVAWNRLLERGLISEKEYEKIKQTLLNRIGMRHNPDAEGLTSEEVLAEIEELHKLKSANLITSKEYQKQKKRLLGMV